MPSPKAPPAPRGPTAGLDGGALLRELVLAISEAEDLSTAILTVLRRVCDATGWVLGQAWTPAADGMLQCHPSWYATGQGFETFREASAKARFLPGVGLPGRVWSTKEPSWIPNVVVDPNFPRAPKALEAGLTTGMAVPVLAHQRVVAVLEFFVRESRAMDPELVRLVAIAAAPLGSLFERKEVEGRLRRSEARFRSVADTANDAIISADAKGNITYANPWAERRFGYEPGELVGQPLTVIMPPRFRDAHRKGLARFLSTREAHVIGKTVELVGFRKDKTEFPVELSISAWQSPEGDEFTGILRDITDRKNVQAKVLESERLLAEAQHVAHVGSWERDCASGEVHWSQEMFSLLGYAPDSVAPSREAFLARVVEADRPHVARLMAAEASGGLTEVEHRVVSRDGSERVLFALAQVVRSVDGKPLRVIGTATDVTERRQAEEVARRAMEQQFEIAQLREVNDFRTQLMNSASHELNTPLTPLRLQLYMLRNGTMGPLTPKQAKALGVLDRNLERLSVLVHNMLDVSRLQSGRLRLSMKEVDVGRVVAEAVESFEETARANGVNLEMEPSAPLIVQADMERLTQVMFNLLSNALKFTPRQGTVRIGARPWGNDWCEISVSDNGSGIPPEQLGRLFQPFSQLANSPPKSGTGLGLYISRGILEEHGGTLEARSDGLGKGATFVLRFPMRRAAD